MQNLLPQGQKTLIDHWLFYALVSCLLFCASPLTKAVTPAPEDATLYIISPMDGAKVTSPFVVKFGLKGMGVAPAGINFPATGHHHLIIDSALPNLARSIPVSEHFRHFGKGQTEAVINLPEGPHTLQLLLGDFAHRPHSPVVVSPQIKITVIPTKKR